MESASPYQSYECAIDRPDPVVPILDLFATDTGRAAPESLGAAC